MTIDQLVENITGEFEDGGVLYTTIEDNLDLILENFIRWPALLEEDVYDEFIMRLEDPTTVYYQQVVDFSQQQRKIMMKSINPDIDGALRGDFGDIGDFENKSTDNFSVFKTEWLPYDFQKFSEALAESIQVSVDMTGVSVLIIASGVLQKKFQINPKPGWYEPLNLYATIIAKPSERKSQVQRAVTDPVYSYEDEENQRRSRDISEYQTKKKILNKRLENALRSSASITKKKDLIKEADIFEIQRELDELEEVTELRLVADDITSESLISLMHQNDERMCIISSEGGIFQIMAGLYNSGNSNIDVYLKAFSGDRVNVDRKGSSSVTLKQPLLSMLLFVQPSVIQEIMENSQFKGKGLLARFFYVFPRSLIGHRKFESAAVPGYISDNYEVALKELLEIPVPKDPETIFLSDAAYKLEKEFYDEIEKQLPNDLEGIQDWAGKFHGQTMRIAGVLHCMEYGKKSAHTKLTEDTMRKAIEMGRYFLEHSKAAFDIMGMTEGQEVRDARYLLKRLDSYIHSQNPQYPQNINKRDFYHYCKGKFPKAEDMGPGLEELCKRNFIRIYKEKNSGAGRPKEFICINPEYIKRKAQDNDR